MGHTVSIKVLQLLPREIRVTGLPVLQRPVATGHNGPVHVGSTQLFGQ